MNACHAQIIIMSDFMPQSIANEICKNDLYLQKCA
jgi:hypothetical protein